MKFSHYMLYVVHHMLKLQPYTHQINIVESFVLCFLSIVLGLVIPCGMGCWENFQTN